MKILIMAGGSGERLWPLSTKRRPKQLLSLFTNRTMIREAVNRVLNYVRPEDIFIATNEELSKLIIDDLTEIPIQNIIIEPAFKDTAAAIAYGGMIICRSTQMDSIIGVLASDHLINNVEDFVKGLETANLLASNGHIVTLGIRPSRPETGYGYIKVEESISNKPSPVLQFMEKPRLEVAKEYIENGNYLWNSGMFFFKYSTLIEEMTKYIPNHVKIISEMKNVIGEIDGIELAYVTKVFFEKFERISIDYAIMEKSDRIFCIPVDLGWSDVGSFNTFEELYEKDCNGNTVVNSLYRYVDSSNNIVISDDSSKRLITSIGIEDIVIVDTAEALLICRKSETQRIKELLKIVK